MGLVGALWPLIESGRIKVFSCDNIAGRAFAEGTGSAEYRCALLDRFEECVVREVVPAIRADCGGDVEVIAAGASLGAFMATAVLCRYPWLFRAAVGMSGSYDLERVFEIAGHRRLLSRDADELRAQPGRAAPRCAAAAVHPPRLRRRSVGESGRTRAARPSARGEGDPEPGRSLGAGVRPRLAGLAGDAATLSRRPGKVTNRKEDCACPSFSAASRRGRTDASFRATLGPVFQLSAPFGFKDPAGRVWPVPSGEKVDGASIPQLFWSFIGGPFEGNYLYASVVHDYYCRVKTRADKDTHLNFYYGMRAKGVPKPQADKMYWAVSSFGPKWQLVGSRGPGAAPEAAVPLPPVDLDDPVTRDEALRRFEEIGAGLEASGEIFDNSSYQVIQVPVTAANRFAMIRRPGDPPDSGEGRKVDVLCDATTVRPDDPERAAGVFSPVVFVTGVSYLWRSVRSFKDVELGYVENSTARRVAREACTVDALVSASATRRPPAGRPGRATACPAARRWRRARPRARPTESLSRRTERVPSYVLCPMADHTDLIKWFCADTARDKAYFGDRDIILGKLADWQTRGRACANVRDPRQSFTCSPTRSSSRRRTPSSSVSSSSAS